MIIRDTRDGKVYPIKGDFATFDADWWARGNGACDCNRAIACGLAEVRTAACGDGRFVIENDDGSPAPEWNGD